MDTFLSTSVAINETAPSDNWEIAQRLVLL